MLFQRDSARNARTALRRGLLAVSSIAVMLVGCAVPNVNLKIWKDAAAYEQVTRFDDIKGTPPPQWFARILDPDSLPTDCVFPLSDRFDFVRIISAKQWAGFVKVTDNLSPSDAPPFDHGVVVGLIAHVGMPNASRWPIHVDLVRHREQVGFVVGHFQPGFYRPLVVPPFVHLVFVDGVKDFLGVKVNTQLYGFNIAVEELNAAIKESQPSEPH